MLFFSKKWVVICTAVLACFIVILTSGITYATNADNFKATIVIDAGHGGWDPGVSGTNSGVKESDLNLSLACFLEKELKNKKFNVVLTRKNSSALGNSKQTDMQARKKIIEDAKPAFVVSIHMNRFPDTKRRGAQVFYDDTKLGADFGNHTQNVLNTHINKQYAGRDNFEALPGDYFITKCYPVPSIIIECGFLSNSEDEKLLKSTSYQKILASIIANAIESMHGATISV